MVAKSLYLNHNTNTVHNKGFVKLKPLQLLGYLDRILYSSTFWYLILFLFFDSNSTIQIFRLLLILRNNQSTLYSTVQVTLDMTNGTFITEDLE